jgi:uncharacterized membrane protein
MSDLIVIGYPDEATAENVWRELIKLQNGYLVDLDVLQTSLPHDPETQLMRALHGDDSAAPTWEQSAASAGSQA